MNVLLSMRSKARNKQMHRASGQPTDQIVRNRTPHLVRLLWHADITVHEQLVMVDVLLHSAVHELEGIQ